MAPASSNPFNPEICFDTPVGRVCFPILSSPTFPGPPVPNTPAPKNWTIIHSPQGEVARATSCTGTEQLLFVNQVERNQESTTRTFYLRRNGELFLTLSGRAHHPSQGSRPQCTSKLSVAVRGEQTDYKMTIAQDSCTTARIVVEANGSVIERTLDFLEPGCPGANADLGLCRALSEGEKEQLKPFEELLMFVNAYYWKQGREALAQLPNLLKNPAEGGTQASFWCGVARAGCWGLAAAGGAACCGVTAGVGCILCSGGFGAAGSGCSEAWSWC